jgi:opacity protein-like surface antigen
MKKIFLIAILANLSLAPLVANAQESVSGGKANRFGIKAGLNLASISDCSIKAGSNTIDIEGGKTTVGFHAGLFDNYSFNRLFGLQVEALFSMQGNKKSKLSYINVPVLLELKPVQNLGILAGPQIGLNVVHPDKYDDTYNLTANEISFDELRKISGSHETAKFDIGVVVGVQYTVTNNLVIGARYNLGLTNIRTFESVKNVNVSGYANRVIQFSAGWLF